MERDFGFYDWVLRDCLFGISSKNKGNQVLGKIKANLMAIHRTARSLHRFESEQGSGLKKWNEKCLLK